MTISGHESGLALNRYDYLIKGYSLPSLVLKDLSATYLAILCREVMSTVGEKKGFVKWVDDVVQDAPRFKALKEFLAINLESPQQREGIWVPAPTSKDQSNTASNPTQTVTATSQAQSIISDQPESNNLPALRVPPVPANTLSTSGITALDKVPPSSNNTGKSVVLVQFSGNGMSPEPKPLTEEELKEELEVTNSKPRLFIVQDISPQTLVLFEDYWNVDPEFFLDYLDLSTRAPTKGKRTVKPTPWYRLGDIEDHLPPLSSTNADIEHIIIRYIGPRELSDPNGNLPQSPVPDRLKSNLRNTYIERVGGGHNPISAESNTFFNTLLKWISGYPIQSQSEAPELHPIALIRHSAAAWFGKESDGQWNKGEPIY